MSSSDTYSDPTIAVVAAETFEGTWPFQAHYSTALGFEIHYIDEGNGPDTLLLLHGEPTWGTYSDIRFPSGRKTPA